jgi:SAM-dependent methyltransferase
MKRLARKLLLAARTRTKKVAQRLGLWKTREGAGDDLDARSYLSSLYLSGQGIEIGALHNPLKVPPKAHVSYVDRLPISELRSHYPELEELPLVDVDVIDDGERLDSFHEGSQDFVIANHFLEHCEDPIGAMENMLRVLKVGGFLYLALPDKRYTFDKDRPVTLFEHLLRDHREGPEWSRRQHYEEYISLVDKVTDEEECQRALERHLSIRYSIHFHVWTLNEMIELMMKLGSVVRYGYEIEAMHRNHGEVIFILCRSD